MDLGGGTIHIRINNTAEVLLLQAKEIDPEGGGGGYNRPNLVRFELRVRRNLKGFKLEKTPETDKAFKQKKSSGTHNVYEFLEYFDTEEERNNRLSSLNQDIKRQDPKKKKKFERAKKSNDEGSNKCSKRAKTANVATEHCNRAVAVNTKHLYVPSDSLSPTSSGNMFVTAFSNCLPSNSTQSPNNAPIENEAASGIFICDNRLVRELDFSAEKDKSFELMPAFIDSYYSSKDLQDPLEL